MKNVIYSQLVSRVSNATVNTRTDVSKKEANQAIQARHANFCADNKESRKDFLRVYKDWYQVYRMRKPAERMVMQSQVDTADKMQTYLAPLMFSGEFCTITSSDSRANDALATRTTSKGKTIYLAPIKWTVAALENAVKYAAKYYAGTEVDIESKFNAR